MDPIAFHLGGLPIYWYGVMIALAFIAGLWTASRRAPLSGISSEIITDLGPWLIIGGLVGARTLFVICYWDEYFADKPWYEVFMIRHGGLVYYGGLIGATLAGIAFARLKRLPLWRTADVIAPSIALGNVFGRIGCLLNGCCYGSGCSLPWAIHFPATHRSYPHGVHPTQVYDALLNLALYLALAWLYRRKKFDGQIFALSLLGYAVTRSFAELFRGDYAVRYLGGWATPAHLISIFILLAGLLLFFLLSRRRTAAK